MAAPMPEEAPVTIAVRSGPGAGRAIAPRYARAAVYVAGMGEEAAAGERARLDVVVPAHNEAESIAWAIRSLREGLDAAAATGTVEAGEVIVAVDRSTDATQAIVDELGQGSGAAVRTVRGDGGLGIAIRAGLAASTGDLVVYTDADLPFDPAELPRLVGVLRRYEGDAVCGYRLDRTTEGARRAAQSHAFNLLVRAVLPVRVRDVNFACKLLTRRALDAVLPELRSEGPFIDAELVARLQRHDLRVLQVGVDYFPRFDAASTLGGIGAVRDILREGWSMRSELRGPP
jgi:glycosyltransferase involved in cell wall biosynthesis